VSESDDKSVSLINLGSLTKPVDTATKGIIEGAGAFLSRICLPAAEEFGLLLKDRVSYWRALNLAKVLKKAETKLPAEVRGASPKLVLPIIEGASLEDKDDLQDLWGNLLASEVDPRFNGPVRTVYIDIIKQLEVIDVHTLNFIYEGYKTGLQVWLQNNSADTSPTIFPISRIFITNKLGIDAITYEDSIDNLIRLRCITSYVESKTIESEHSEFYAYTSYDDVTYDYRYENVCMTSFGVGFMKACSARTESNLTLGGEIPDKDSS
jgi:hypothetical protein